MFLDCGDEDVEITLTIDKLVDLSSIRPFRVEAKTETGEVVGVVVGAIFNLGDYSARKVFIEADSESGAWLEAMETVYTIEGELKIDFDGSDYFIEPNLVLFEKVQVLPKMRGYELGLRMINFASDAFGFLDGNLLLMLKAIPIPCLDDAFSPNHENTDQSYILMPEDEGKLALKKLKNYYKRSGFRTLKGANKSYMFIFTGNSSPELDQLDSFNESEYFRKKLKKKAKIKTTIQENCQNSKDFECKDPINEAFNTSLIDEY
jgi:hypothetical protein